MDLQAKTGHEVPLGPKVEECSTFDGEERFVQAAHNVFTKVNNKLHRHRKIQYSYSSLRIHFARAYNGADARRKH